MGRKSNLRENRARGQSLISVYSVALNQFGQLRTLGECWWVHVLGPVDPSGERLGVKHNAHHDSPFFLLEKPWQHWCRIQGERKLFGCA